MAKCVRISNEYVRVTRRGVFSDERARAEWLEWEEVVFEFRTSMCM